MTTKKQDNEFLNEIIGTSLLQTSLDWIAEKLSPDEVFSKKDLIEFISDTCDPADVFSSLYLEKWADENGYVKE